MPYVKSSGRNIILHEGRRQDGLGAWPGAAALAAQAAPPLAPTVSPFSTLASQAQPSPWGALAAQAQNNPFAAASPKSTAPAGDSSFLGRLAQQASNFGQNIGNMLGSAIGGASSPAAATPQAPMYAPASSGPGVMTYAVIGGLGLAAVLLLKKKKSA